MLLMAGTLCSPVRRAMIRADASFPCGTGMEASVQLEANTDYDKPHAEWYWLQPGREQKCLLILTNIAWPETNSY